MTDRTANVRACFLLLLLTFVARVVSASDIVHLEFSSDGLYLAALDDEGTLHVCDTVEKTEIFRIERKLKDNRVAWRPGKHEIACVLDEGFGWDIYLISLDGQRRRLTRHPARDDSPQWIENGKELVFASYRKSGADLYRLTFGPEDEPTVYPFVNRPYDQWAPRSRPGAGGVAVAYLSYELGRPEVWIATPGREPRPIGSLGSHYQYRDTAEFGWEAAGRLLLYVERDEEKARLHAFNPATDVDTILFEDKDIRSPVLDLAHAQMLFETEGKIARRNVQGLDDPKIEGAKKTLVAGDLRMGLPTLGVHGDQATLWAAAVEGRCVALGDSHLKKINILYLDFEDHLYCAERLYAQGGAREAELLYADLEKRARQPAEIALLRFHHAIRLRKANQPRKALEELDRLADNEPPIADNLRILALQGEILFFELRDLEAARQIFEDVAWASEGGESATPGEARPEPLIFLEQPNAELARHYADAHAALRADNPQNSLKAMRRMVLAAPADIAARNAILELLNNPYDADSIEEKPNPFAPAQYLDAISDVLEILDAAPESEPFADESARLVAQRLRQELIQTQLDARRFDKARKTALKSIEIDGIESLGLIDFLRFYLGTSRSGTPMHNMLGKVLFDPSVAPEIERRLTGNAEADSLLKLGQIKIGLLEGDLKPVGELLEATRQQFKNIPKEELSPEVATLQRYLHLFTAKYHERQKEWAQAASAYKTALELTDRYEPKETGTILDIEVALLEASGAATAGADGLDPEHLWRTQIYQRGMGDPLLNPTYDEDHLRMVVGNQNELLRSVAPSALDVFLLYHIGRNLGRCGMRHCAVYYLDRALNAAPPQALRLAILYEKTRLFASPAENFHQQWRVFEEMETLIPTPRRRDPIRLSKIEPLRRLGMRSEALVLLKDLAEKGSFELIRATAAQEYEYLLQPEGYTRP